MVCGEIGRILRRVRVFMSRITGLLFKNGFRINIPYERWIHY